MQISAAAGKKEATSRDLSYIRLIFLNALLDEIEKFAKSDARLRRYAAALQILVEFVQCQRHAARQIAHVALLGLERFLECFEVLHPFDGEQVVFDVDLIG